MRKVTGGAIAGSVTQDTVITRVERAFGQLAGLVRHDAAWLEVDLTMGQTKALVVLHCQGPLAVGALARQLGIGEPAASLLVDKLEVRGLARREGDPADRRRTLVLLTDSGQDLVMRFRATRADRLAEWLLRLDDDELRMLSRGMEALLRVAEADRRSADERDDA